MYAEEKAEKAKDVLFYIGNQYNPTIEHFLEEAKRLGCSRRVYKYPAGVKIGESRAFLIHDTKKIVACRGCGLSTKDVDLDVKLCPKCGSPNIFTVHFYSPVIFAYYVIQAAEFIIDDNTMMPRDYIEKGVKPVHISVVMREPLRGCGRRKVGALYLVSYPDSEPIVPLDPPVPYVGGHFRGFKYCDGDEILQQSKILKQTEYIWKA